MSIKASKQYAIKKRAIQQRKRQLTYLALILALITVIGGGIFAFTSGAGAKSNNPALGVATFSNPNNPECPTVRH